MPTYQYLCTACERPLEAQQRFSDDALTECPECGGRLRKVFSAVGVVFKGSGFYRNDSRAAANGSEGSTSGDSGDKGGDKGADKSSEKSSEKSSASVRGQGRRQGRRERFRRRQEARRRAAAPPTRPPERLHRV